MENNFIEYIADKELNDELLQKVKLKDQIAKKRETTTSCENCGKYSYQVHHIVYRSRGKNDGRLHHRYNLAFLCVDCHNKVHNGDLTRYARRSFSFTKETALNNL